MALGRLIEVQRVDRGLLVSEDSFNTGDVQDVIPIKSQLQGVLTLTEANMVRVLIAAQILNDLNESSGPGGATQSSLRTQIDLI